MWDNVTKPSVAQGGPPRGCGGLWPAVAGWAGGVPKWLSKHAQSMVFTILRDFCRFSRATLTVKGEGQCQNHLVKLTLKKHV